MPYSPRDIRTVELHHQPVDVEFGAERAGLAVAGEALRGSSGSAGEVGHIRVDAGGPVCSCGERGCLGMLCTPTMLVQEAVAAGVLEKAVDGNDTIAVDSAFTDLCRVADAVDRQAAEIIDRSAAHVARAVINLTDMLDADQVIFGGPYWSRVPERYLRVIPSALASSATARSGHPVTVRSTTMGEDVGAVGAASLVLDHTFSPHPSVLLLRPHDGSARSVRSKDGGKHERQPRTPRASQSSRM